uniref:Uncharacterized protein n=1 Tax=viral metagenome TaxID=1070528 RepID=A0A6C0KQE8_9ZZZZ
MTKRRTVKRNKLRRSKRRAANGGGWSELPEGSFKEVAVNPGNQVHFQYSGPGKDCTGNPMSIRPGHIFDYTPKGLPGLSGGKNRRNRNRRGGAALPSAASILPGPVTNPNLPPVSGSVTPKPDSFPDTTGAGGSVGRPDVIMSMPGVPPPGMAQMPKVALDASANAQNLAPPQKGGRRMKGGRYGFFPAMGPLNPENGVGVSPAPFGRIPCEAGTYNPLNPNPNDVQGLTTAPLTPPYVTKPFSGGGVPAGSGLAASAANFPVVQVGDADSMRYYAPTAGYRNDFMTFRAPSAVPGLTIQTPYDAKAFNQACIKTGGSRKKRGGAGPVAFDAGAFTPVTINEVWTRKDFDGSNKGLPVKFGGRKTKRASKKTRKTRKTRKQRKQRK